MSALKFPDGFLWGAATAAHQVEGANDNNDWWEWEQTQGHIRNADRSIVACDWYKNERYVQDFDLAKSFGHQAHRLSIEWSRIEPRPGEWDQNAIEFYRRVLMALRERGITPLVTLHHFANPLWLRDRGAWETPAIVPLFERYATKVAQELGDLCDFWVTINEPIVYLSCGYVTGDWPPGKAGNVGLALQVAKNMLRGHAVAYRAIHRVQPNARVGLAHNLNPVTPVNPASAGDRLAAQLRDYLFNRMFLHVLRDGTASFPLGAIMRVPEAVGTQDYIGLNFYFSRRIKFDLTQPGMWFGRTLPAQPWGVSYDDELDEWFGKGDLDPNGFCRTIKWLAEYYPGKPIYITENGICDRHDELRPRFLVSYLAAMHRAIQAGAPVKGYFYWSLADNFEWIEGYGLRFGLIHVDHVTQKRTPKPSAELYARIIRENAISEDLLNWTQTDLAKSEI